MDIIDTDHGAVMLPGGPGWKDRMHRQMKQQRESARKPLKPDPPKKGIESWSLDFLVGELLRFRAGTLEYERVWAEYVRRYPEAALIPFTGGGE